MPHAQFLPSIIGALQDLWKRGGVSSTTFAQAQDALNRDVISAKGLLDLLSPGAWLPTDWGSVSEQISQIGGEMAEGYSIYQDYEVIDGVVHYPESILRIGPDGVQYRGGTAPVYNGGGAYLPVTPPVGTEVGLKDPRAAFGYLKAAATAAGRVLREKWDELPEWARNIIIAAGVLFPEGVPFIDIPWLADDAAPGTGILPLTPGAVVPVGSGGLMSGAQVVGRYSTRPDDPNPPIWAWFYRLADGKLAVQNKKGRWKVWRPKSPIVLYSGSGNSTKNILRASRVLKTQAKKTRKFMDRWDPKPRAPRAHKHARAVTNVVDVT